VPVNQSQLTTDGQITYRTVLTNAPGVVDQVPGNNRAASTLTAPPAPAPAP
jgi:hypothetical protein